MTGLATPAGLFDLTGRSALITGATGALGGAAARALAGAGARVTLAGSNRDKLARLADELTEAGASVAMVVGRPGDEAAADALVSAAVAHGGTLDVLIGASGTSVVKPALDMDPAEWDRVMDANVRQMWLVCRSAGRVMTGQDGGGRIVLVSSVRARFATRAGTSAYGPSKAAVDMLTRSLATEWGPHGVTVNAIAPTVFRSDLTAWLFKDDAQAARDAVLERIPLGRLAEPDDFAGAILLLAARAGALITGEVLHVDGGFSCN